LQPARALSVPALIESATVFCGLAGLSAKILAETTSACRAGITLICHAAGARALGEFVGDLIRPSLVFRPTIDHETVLDTGIQLSLNPRSGHIDSRLLAIELGIICIAAPESQ
jgi:hypothetical protein